MTGHELLHVTHISDGSFKIWLRDYGLNGAINITEFNAYKWQAHQESILGVNYGAAFQLAKYRNLLPAGYLNR